MDGLKFGRKGGSESVGDGVRPSASLSGVGKREKEAADPVLKNGFRGGDIGVAREVK